MVNDSTVAEQFEAVQMLEGLAHVIDNMSAFTTHTWPAERDQVVLTLRNAAKAVAVTSGLDIAEAQVFGDEWTRAIWRSIVGDLIEEMYDHHLRQQPDGPMGVSLTLTGPTHD